MIERYEKEMRRIFDSTPKPVPAVMAAVYPEQIPEEPELLEPLPEEKIQTEEPAFPEGKVTAWVTTGRGAVPISGATVIFSKADENDSKGRRELIAVKVTDKSGKTPPITVRTEKKELSLEPGSSEPFSTVYITAFVPGFEPIREMPADIFEGELSVQKIDLVPKPEEITIKGGAQNW